MRSLDRLKNSLKIWLVAFCASCAESERRSLKSNLSSGDTNISYLLIASPKLNGYP
jgi:hypothetical protein